MGTIDRSLVSTYIKDKYIPGGTAHTLRLLDDTVRTYFNVLISASFSVRDSVRGINICKIYQTRNTRIRFMGTYMEFNNGEIVYVAGGFYTNYLFMFQDDIKQQILKASL